jgi:stalled ribosome alternative rescue factor ArfA
LRRIILPYGVGVEENVHVPALVTALPPLPAVRVVPSLESVVAVLHEALFKEHVESAKADGSCSRQSALTKKNRVCSRALIFDFILNS